MTILLSKFFSSSELLSFLDLNPHQGPGVTHLPTSLPTYQMTKVEPADAKSPEEPDPLGTRMPFSNPTPILLCIYTDANLPGVLT